MQLCDLQIKLTVSMVSALLFQDAFKFLYLNEPGDLLSHTGFYFTFIVFIQTWIKGETSCTFSDAF